MYIYIYTHTHTHTHTHTYLLTYIHTNSSGVAVGRNLKKNIDDIFMEDITAQTGFLYTPLLQIAS